MTYKKCQSCGMPLKKDPEGGGTEKDGSQSLKYCSHCYKDGEFTQPNITAEQMQELVLEKLSQMKIPRFMGKMLVKNIPRLERWV